MSTNNGMTQWEGPEAAEGAGPDYDLEEVVEASTPQQLKAIGDETRITILEMLNERAATVGELAGALDRPKGSVAYHVKVLEEAGLVRMVRTRRVRAIDEKFYGRTARTFMIMGLPDDKEPFFFLNEAMRECRFIEGERLPMFTARHVRMTRERAEQFAERVLALAREFASSGGGGDRVYGLVAGLYPTERPLLPDREGEE